MKLLNLTMSHFNNGVRETKFFEKALAVNFSVRYPGVQSEALFHKIIYNKNYFVTIPN
jgi:hypothetical protein